MDKIKRQACIAYLEGMAEEIKNFDASSSDPAEFVAHIKEMVNIVFEQTAGSPLSVDPEAEAAIKEAVEEAENAQKKAIDAMVQSCKESNAAKITMSGKRPDGYIYEIIIRKDGAVAYDEFTKEQLEEIEDIWTKEILDICEGIPDPELQIYLDIINVCRAQLEKPEYSSMKDFLSRQSH